MRDIYDDNPFLTVVAVVGVVILWLAMAVLPLAFAIFLALWLLRSCT